MTSLGGAAMNFEPSSVGVIQMSKDLTTHEEKPEGAIGRHEYPSIIADPNVDYLQPCELFMTVFSEEQRQRCMDNIAGGLGQCRKDIQERMVALFTKVHPSYGAGVAERIGLVVEK